MINKSLYRNLDKKLLPLKIFLLSLADPVCLVINKPAKSILDVGCGQGLPMQMIKMRMNVKRSVGVDIHIPYIKESKKKRIHNQYIKTDIRFLPFKDKSFDVVIGLQVLEHLLKKDSWKVLEKMERIAKKQVIIATPIGKTYHPAVDGNKHQLHLSGFYPNEFTKRGYKIIRMGRKSILGEEGLVHKCNNDLLRKMIFFVSLILDFIFYFLQDYADYYFVAYKDMM